MINYKNIPKQSGIYKFVNKMNNKVYIGRAKNLRSRINTHINDYKKNKINNYLYSSIQKYGLKNFEVEILVQGDFNNNELNQMEITFIRLFNSNNPLFGYNLTAGGGGISNYNHSEEAKEKMRKPKSKEQIEKRRKTIQEKGGIVWSEEYKQNMSNVKKGKLKSEETKQKMRKPKSEETKQKMRNVQKGRIKSEEHKKKISESKKGIKQNLEYVKKRVKAREFNKNMKLIKENNFVYDWLF